MSSARQGEAWRSAARSGKAWRGQARQGTARLGMARHGKARKRDSLGHAIPQWASSVEVPVERSDEPTQDPTPAG